MCCVQDVAAFEEEAAKLDEMAESGELGPRCKALQEALQKQAEGKGPHLRSNLSRFILRIAAINKKVPPRAKTAAGFRW